MSLINRQNAGPQEQQMTHFVSMFPAVGVLVDICMMSSCCAAVMPPILGRIQMSRDFSSSFAFLS
jgi:hypothetical protein